MKNKVEIIANSILAVTGIVLGIFFYTEKDPGLSSIMFSIALACILYQFLGGIANDQSFQLGAIKLGGAAAVLVMFMYFLSEYIIPKNDYSIDPQTGWIPIDAKTGEIKSIKILKKDSVIQFPGALLEEYKADRRTHPLQLRNIEGESYKFIIETKNNEPVGCLNLDDIKTKTLFRKLIATFENDLVLQSFILRTNEAGSASSNQCSEANIPFEIKVFNGSRFSLITKSDSIFNQKYSNVEIVPKTSYVVPYTEGESYIVFLEQANSEVSNRFSKWLVKKIKHTL